MGYCISQGDTNFTMQKENFPAAIKALDIEEGTDPKTAIDTFLQQCRWHPEFDEEGNICHIDFYGEKLGEEEELFRLLGPYVDKDSYITISGEDDNIWRYDFDGKEMEENSAVMDFDYNTEIVEKILEQKKLLPTLIGLHPKLDARIAKALDD